MVNIKKYVLVLVTILWMSLIFYMSSKPAQESDKTSLKVVQVISQSLKLEKEQVENLNFIVRKTAHFTEYFILSMLVTVTYCEFNKGDLNKSFILLICVLVAMGDEFLQSFILGRGSQVRDVLIDFGGSFSQLIVYIFLKKAFYRKKGLERLKFH